MRENRTSGSVRGALGNRRSYREILETIFMIKGRFFIRLIKNFIFISIGICILTYSYFLWSHKGYSLFPTSWGFLQGHKDLGIIAPLLIGILFIAQAIYELNTILRDTTVNKRLDED